MDFTIEQLQELLNTAKQNEQVKAHQLVCTEAADAALAYIESLQASETPETAVNILTAWAALQEAHNKIVANVQGHKEPAAKVAANGTQRAAPAKRERNKAEGSGNAIADIAAATGLDNDAVEELITDMDAVKHQWKVKADGARASMRWLHNMGCNVEETINGGKLYLVNYLGFEMGLAKTYCSNNYAKCL